jgi:hypothetical protein
VVGAALLGLGVDDPATGSGRLQPLGLGSAGLTAPLVASGRALVQRWVPAMCGDLEVGGLAPLRPGLGKPIRGSGAPPTTAGAVWISRYTDDLATARSHANAACASRPFAVDGQGSPLGRHRPGRPSSGRRIWPPLSVGGARPTQRAGLINEDEPDPLGSAWNRPVGSGASRRL